jgi:hypothetical protein
MTDDANTGDSAAETDAPDTDADGQPMAPGQAEAEELLNTVLPFAEQQVEQEGGFLPYGAALTDEDDVVFVGGVDDDDDSSGDTPEDEDAEIDEDARLEAVREALRAGAQRGDYLATAVIFDVTITTAESEDDDSEEETDAIAVELDTVGGFCAMTFLPYKEEEDGGVTFGEVIAQDFEHTTFA